MKCFKCGALCITNYMRRYEDNTSQIIAVRKECTICDWKSYPTKVPESLE